MLNFIEDSLSSFRNIFSRKAAFNWFVVIILGLMTRLDSLGVTSFIRALSLNPGKYETLLHFFRSDAFSLNSLKHAWHRLVRKDGRLYQLNGRTLLIGDGTKHPKEGRYMPGVKKLFQESENSSKPAYIFGHMYGGVAAVICRKDQYFALPLDLNIQDGLAETSQWKQGAPVRSDSHVVQMIRNGYEAAASLGASYMALDRYFLTVPALEELDRLNLEKPLLQIITRAKTSCVAYELPPVSDTPRRGRPRKKGASVKLNTLFESRASEFIKAEVMMYGKKETVEYLCLDLLWGSKLYKKLRFVLVRSSKGECILVCTDLTLDPVLIIEAYAHRFKIELMFRELKQQIHVFSYHFWTKAMPKLKRYKKKNDSSELTGVEKEEEKNRILKTVEATERFVLCASIAMGLTQMIALTPDFAETVRTQRYLRTSSIDKVSEATVLDYLRKNIFRLLYLNRHSGISQLIFKLQAPIFDTNENSIPY